MNSNKTNNPDQTQQALRNLIAVDDTAAQYWISHLKQLEAAFLRDDSADHKPTRLRVLAANEELMQFFNSLNHLS